MTIRAVLFDLYDTLLYTRETGSREQAMKVLAASGIPREDWRRGWYSVLAEAMRGTIPSVLGRVRKALEEAGCGNLNGDLLHEVGGLMLARESPHLYSDVPAGLTELRTRGYRLGLISNMEPEQAHWVQQLNLHKYLDATILSCEVGLLKPEPEIYRLAAECLSVPCDECVFVADGVYGELPGAQAVGMTAVRIDRSVRELEEARDENFDFRVRNLEELLAWLPGRTANGA